MSLSTSWTQSYVPVIVNGEVFFKTQLETAEGLIFAEVTVANFEEIDGQFYNRTFLKRGLEADMLVGYLREEPENGRLYFRPQQNPQEVLVYDMSLEVGDQIELAARWCDDQRGDMAEVVAVRTVAGRREVTFNRRVGEDLICDTLRFLEGVGPSASVIFPLFRNAVLDNGVAMSICQAARSGEVFYPAGRDEDFCGLDITGVQEITAPQSLIVYPNPTDSQLSLRNLPEDAEILLYGPDGRIACATTATSQLDVSALPAGLLNLVIWRDGKIWTTKRILKL